MPSDMYENLGNLLNDILEKGTSNEPETEKQEDKDEINKKINTESEKNNTESAQTDKTSHKKQINLDKMREKDAIQTGELIHSSEFSELHKYTEFMQFPAEIQNALITLDIAYPITAENIKKRYRELSKQLHPDSKLQEKEYKITIQSSYNVYKSILLDFKTLTECYKILINYFTV